MEKLWQISSLIGNRDHLEQVLLDLLSPLVSIIILPKSLMNCNDKGEKHPRVSLATGIRIWKGARFAYEFLLLCLGGWITCLSTCGLNKAGSRPGKIPYKATPARPGDQCLTIWLFTITSKKCFFLQKIPIPLWYGQLPHSVVKGNYVGVKFWL